MALSLAAANTTTLSKGRTMPVVGFGCAGQLSRGPIGLALEQGYRLFDTSQATEWYLEAELGEALQAFHQLLGQLELQGLREGGSGPIRSLSS